MVKKCCIQYCKSECYSGCGISFHSFPKNYELLKKWINTIPCTQVITKNSVVCGRHFKSSDFRYANSRNYLKPNVVPSIFPKKQKRITFPSDIQTPPKVDRFILWYNDAVEKINRILDGRQTSTDTESATNSHQEETESLLPTENSNSKQQVPLQQQSPAITFSPCNKNDVLQLQSLAQTK